MIPTRTLRSRIATMKVEVGPKRPHFLLTCASEDFRLTCMGCSCNTCKRAVARLDSILPQRSFVPRSCGPMRDSTDPMCFCVTGSSDDMSQRQILKPNPIQKTSLLSLKRRDLGYILIISRVGYVIPDFWNQYINRLNFSKA